MNLHLVLYSLILNLNKKNLTFIEVNNKTHLNEIGYLSLIQTTSIRISILLKFSAKSKRTAVGPIGVYKTVLQKYLLPVLQKSKC